jgi:hypothetical protein
VQSGLRRLHDELRKAGKTVVYDPPNSLTHHGAFCAIVVLNIVYFCWNRPPSGIGDFLFQISFHSGYTLAHLYSRRFHSILHVLRCQFRALALSLRNPNSFIHFQLIGILHSQLCTHCRVLNSVYGLFFFVISFSVFFISVQSLYFFIAINIFYTRTSIIPSFFYPLWLAPWVIEIWFVVNSCTAVQIEVKLNPRNGKIL